jgi:hypothetical protein
MSYRFLFAGNDQNTQSNYLQHKDNAWIGGSVDVMGGRNGHITVSMNVCKQFQFRNMHAFDNLQDHVVSYFQGCVYMLKAPKGEEVSIGYMVLYF